MSRTTLHLDDELVSEAKDLAARTGRTLTDVIEDALRAALTREPEHPHHPVKLPTYGQGGLHAGVPDISHSADLGEYMEELEGRRDKLQRGQ
jgi:hypothetical protein